MAFKKKLLLWKVSIEVAHLLIRLFFFCCLIFQFWKYITNIISMSYKYLANISSRSAAHHFTLLIVSFAVQKLSNLMQFLVISCYFLSIWSQIQKDILYACILKCLPLSFEVSGHILNIWYPSYISVLSIFEYTRHN